MTVANENNKSVHISTGATNTYVYNFYVRQASDLHVFFGNERQTSGYTVQDVGNPNGGNVVFDTNPPVSITITLIRVVQYLQGIDYREYDPFPAEVNEQGLDNLTYMIQQIAEQIGRAVIAQLGSDPDVDLTLPPYAPGKALKWDAAQKRLINSINDVT